MNTGSFTDVQAVTFGITDDHMLGGQIDIAIDLTTTTAYIHTDQGITESTIFVQKTRNYLGHIAVFVILLVLIIVVSVAVTVVAHHLYT